MSVRLLPHYTLLFLTMPLGCATGEPVESAANGEVSRSELVAESQTTLEEDFSYPGAETYLASGITLKKGDGNLLLVDCANQDYVLKVESFAGNDDFCFKIRGQSAYVTMELPEVFLIWTTNAAVTASVVVNGQKSPVQLKQGYNSFVYGSGSSQVYATLVELKLSS